MTGRPLRVPTSQSSRIRASTLDVALRAIAGVVGRKLASVRLAMLASSRYLIGFIWLVHSYGLAVTRSPGPPAAAAKAESSGRAPSRVLLLMTNSNRVACRSGHSLGRA